MGAPVVDITIVKGKTFEFMYRYADSDLVYLPILGMPSTAPVRLNVASHGIPDGWPVRIEDLRRPEGLSSDEAGCDSHYFATVVDFNTIELNQVSVSGSRPWAGGGVVVFNRPFDLSGCSARMQVRDRVDGALLLSLSSDPMTLRDGSIQIDTGLAALIVKLEPAKTALLSWVRGTYDLELITPGGDVYPVAAVSKVTVSPEVTR